jgi:t-SNARE complex subunit (syntaxin)
MSEETKMSTNVKTSNKPAKGISAIFDEINQHRKYLIDLTLPVWERNVRRFRCRVENFTMKFLNPMIDSWKAVQNIKACPTTEMEWKKDENIAYAQKLLKAVEYVTVITQYPKSIDLFLNCKDLLDHDGDDEKTNVKWCVAHYDECVKRIRMIHSLWKQLLEKPAWKQIIITADRSWKGLAEDEDIIRKGLDECFE